MSSTQSPINKELIKQHGISDDEYQQIVKHLGREPNLTELGVFSVMWSEHCSYKSSRVHLKHLPTEGKRVVQGPGENAGAVDIGDGLAAVFKNRISQPSFIYQTLSGCSHRGRRNPSRYFHDGSSANRLTQLSTIWRA